jgi:hypothetical protein
MELIKVESSMINAVSYDAKTHILTVIFNSGKAYEYHEVMPETHQELMDSASKGSYMRSCIIDCYPTSMAKGRKTRK